MCSANFGGAACAGLVLHHISNYTKKVIVRMTGAALGWVQDNALNVADSCEDHPKEHEIC